MPRYIIERKIPGVGNGPIGELRTFSKMSRAAMNKLRPRIKWVKSFVTESKIYCEYIAANRKVLMNHAKLSRLPATRIVKVMAVIRPTNIKR